MLNVTRTDIVLTPDPSRVLLRDFTPGDAQRIHYTVARIQSLPDDRVEQLLAAVIAGFSWRHRQIEETLLRRFDQLDANLPGTLSIARQMLIGSYFLAEYSVESASLFNPSIVAHPEQSELPEGALRCVLSLRATGEGHISSVTFRTVVLHADRRIEVMLPHSGVITEPRQMPNHCYEKPLFERKLQEMGLSTHFINRVTHRLRDCFELHELRIAIDEALQQEANTAGVLHEDRNAALATWTLASSNYEVQFEQHQPLSERILFPSTSSQRNGIEDARFVQFRNEDGSHTYFATFTAYDGRTVVPELVETEDFLRFRFVTLNGPAAQNKGLALFPRKIGGKYAMLSRQDNESISIMFSTNVHFWNEQQLLLKPEYPWEMIQIGNCGSPIETDAGWLVLSHGVGPMRQYALGAFLLDLDDPTKVIGRLREPLLEPNSDEREGYVPNVVYSCGSIVHAGQLIVPYGRADQSTGFVTVPLADLLAELVRLPSPLRLVTLETQPPK